MDILLAFVRVAVRCMPNEKCTWDFESYILIFLHPAYVDTQTLYTRQLDWWYMDTFGVAVMEHIE